MKKIYFWAMMALAATAANAQDPAVGEPVAAESGVSNVLEAVKQNKTRSGVESMMGTYVWRYWQAGASQAGRNDTLTFTQDPTDPTKVKIDGFKLENVTGSVVGTIDEEARTLTIPRTPFKLPSGSYAIFQSYKVDGANTYNYSPLADPIVFTYYGGVWKMKARTAFGAGFYNKADDANPVSTYWVRFNNQFWGDVQWQEMGTTKFIDQFFSVCFGWTVENGKVAEKDVTVHRAAPGVDIFKVDGAIAAVPAKNKPMLIDATDPTHVLIPVQGSNVSSTGRGQIYYTNVDFMNLNPVVNSGDLFTVCTLKDGVITIPKNNVRTNWCEWYNNNGADASKSWFTWTTSKECTLVLPDNEVAVDEIGNENAPVEYYNLQGVKVANPENGIFIRRQGSKATKVVM